MSERRVMVVEWIDSCLQNVQVGKEDYPTPEVIRSVGWVVVSNKDYITVARDDHKLDQFRGLVCIPVECIRSKYRLVEK